MSRSAFRGLSAGLLLATLGSVSSPLAQHADLTVRITSPLGRTGLPGTVRIVAQVDQLPEGAVGQVRFFVDQQLLTADTDGPPYATEWVDENPFERREISVEVTDGRGREARDRVVLEPFEVTEAAEVSSVLLEASVQDKTGRFVKGLDAAQFTVTENDQPQTLDVVRQETVGATFALMIDSSASMSRRIDFVQRTAATLASYLGPKDRMIVAPFSRTLEAVTGPTNDLATIADGIRAVRPVGGTAILDSLTEVSRSLASAEGRRAIVLITDGYDEHSTTSFDDALREVRSAGATLYVVGIGGVAGISIKGERLLRQLAVETGGRSFFPSRNEQLAEVHDTLTEDVQNRYLITYTPANQTADGSWRDVKVAAREPGFVVRTRPGYFAPKPPPIRAQIEFTAVDAGGRFIDLTTDDLQVVEDGRPQRVETFQEAIDPVAIVLALDASGSMKRKETDVIASAREFVGALQERDSLALVTFGDRVKFMHDLSRAREFSESAIGEYVAAGGTALYDALGDSLQRLKAVGGRRVVVVMTDGRDEDNAGTAAGSRRSLADVMKLLKESGASVYAIGLGTNVERGVLEQLADQSGGQAFFPADVSALPGEFQRVVDGIRRRYVVGYTSTQTDRDGAWRKVVITVKGNQDATVRSGGGYFAPAR